MLYTNESEVSVTFKYVNQCQIILLHLRGGGGYLNMFERTGTCHYLGVPFFLKVQNYRYKFLKHVRNYSYYLKKHSELWVSFWENIAKLLEFTDEIYVILRCWVKDMQKLFDDYFVL